MNNANRTTSSTSSSQLRAVGARTARASTPAPAPQRTAPNLTAAQRAEQLRLDLAAAEEEAAREEAARRQEAEAAQAAADRATLVAQGYDPQLLAKAVAVELRRASDNDAEAWEEEADIYVPEGTNKEEESEAIQLEILAAIEKNGGAVIRSDVIKAVEKARGGIWSTGAARHALNKMTAEHMIYQGRYRRRTAGAAIIEFWVARPEDAVKVWKGEIKLTTHAKAPRAKRKTAGAARARN